MTFPATENGVSGARYTASGKSIFLPQTNSRGGADGTLYMNDGAYRSKTDWNGSTAYSISIGATGIGADSYLNALSIRCVKGAK